MTTITENWLTTDTGGSLADAAYDAWTVLVPVGGGGTGPAAQDSVLFSRAAVTVIKVATASNPVGANQEIEAVVSGLTNADGNAVALWTRFDETVDYNPDIATTGYGLALQWLTDGTRNLGISKINKTAGAIEDMGNTVVTLVNGPDGTDLATSQIIRFVTVTLPDDSVLLRGYLNQGDDGLPTIQVIDKGQSVAGASSTVHRGAGTYALTLGGTTTVMVDSVTARDDYALSGFGDYKVGYRTLSELRTELIYSVERGAISTNLDSIYLNIVINQAVKGIMNEIEDIAGFSRKLKVFTLTEDDDKRVILPYDVDRVLQIYDRTNHLTAYWRKIETDANNHEVITMESPGAREFQVDYIEKWEPMAADTDLCVIPEKYDEIVIAGASLRLARADRDARYVVAMEKTYRAALKRLKIALNAKLRQNKGHLHISDFHRPFTVRYGAAWQHRGPF